MENKHRDFVDFTIELVNKRRIFYFFLVICLSYATYFNMYKNTTYKYETILKISPESVLDPIITNINVYKTATAKYLNPLRGGLNYMGFQADLCTTIKSTFVDRLFFEDLTQDYLNKHAETLNRSQVFQSLKGALHPNPKSGRCVLVEATGDMEVIEYLRKYYVSMVNMYLDNEISKRLEVIREGRINFLSASLESTDTRPIDASRANVLGQLELNTMEERHLALRSQLEIIENTPIVDTDVPYFIYSVSNVQQTLRATFLYSFAIFISFILHVLAIVLTDFRKQFILRNK